jgi:hypothetical protein
MIERILSIAGKPGLYRFISQSKNMLIVENVTTGKRMPAYSHDKVLSLADISIYTTGDDTPLYSVFQSISDKTEGNPVEVKNMSENEIRSYFGEFLPEYDQDRVHTSDIRKVFQWYNILASAGINKFKDEEIAEDQAAEAAEAADEAQS